MRDTKTMSLNETTLFSKEVKNFTISFLPQQPSLSFTPRKQNQNQKQQTI